MLRKKYIPESLPACVAGPLYGSSLRKTQVVKESLPAGAFSALSALNRAAFLPPDGTSQLENAGVGGPRPGRDRPGVDERGRRCGARVPSAISLTVPSHPSGVGSESFLVGKSYRKRFKPFLTSFCS